MDKPFNQAHLHQLYEGFKKHIDDEKGAKGKM
jgi:hypothetical protein